MTVVSHLGASFIVLERLSFERTTGMGFCLVLRKLKCFNKCYRETHVAQGQAFSCLVVLRKMGHVIGCLRLRPK